MSASVQSTACQPPPPENRNNSPVDKHLRPARLRPALAVALHLLPVAAAVVLLALMCRPSTGARPQPSSVDAPPATTAEEVVAASAPVSDTPSEAVSVPRGPAAPADEQFAAGLPPMDDGPLPASPAPAPDKEAKPGAAAVAPPPPASRRPELSEDDLRKQLAAVPEVRLPPSVVPTMIRSYKTDFTTSNNLSGQINFDPFILLKYFPRAAELPVRSAPGCQLSQREAVTLGVLAKKLHAYLDLIAPKDPTTGKRAEPTQLRAALRQERRGQRPEWLRAEAVPAMQQILMAEDTPLRLVLVDLLADIEAKPATVALARRAVFDLAPEVRKSAIEALRDRPPADSRQVFVDALRYPWPPAADHAAEALVALEDRDAAPLLVAQLGKPDPAAPYTAGKSGTGVRQLVRLNHVANCLLCHVPAINGEDPVVGIDPFATLQRGGGGGWGRPAQPSTSQSLLIRADVQFLRQDFSVAFPVGLPGIAVDGVRFDFLLRTRRLTRAELQTWKPPPDPTAYPQRDATLFALRALTGKDVGPTTEAWLALYPQAEAEAAGVRLSTALLRATPEQREQLLIRYRDARDEGMTAALASAAAHLEGKVQERAREALIGRLARLAADELRTHLEDEDTELRRAAALACVRKADKELVPDLIGLLLTGEPDVTAGAHESLQRLTGKDFGPAGNADQEARTAAAAEWQAWWRQQATP
jgi:HEAT repeat protein